MIEAIRVRFERVDSKTEPDDAMSAMRQREMVCGG